MEDQVDFEYEPEAEIDRLEGVEHLQDKTLAQLYEMLGLEKQTIPFFREEIAVGHDMPGELGEPESSATTTEGFSLRWHQLVGITKMMERAMTSQPVLLMDDIGLGKTLQVLAFFAMLAYYRTVYTSTKEYPGIWGNGLLLDCENLLTDMIGKEGAWTDHSGRRCALPDHPFLIVVPQMLVKQVTLECTRILKPESLDVFMITQASTKHGNVWQAADQRSRLPAHMRLYVASTSVSVNL
jgi:SNF2 family DNA or RNA helicase